MISFMPSTKQAIWSACFHGDPDDLSSNPAYLNLKANPAGVNLERLDQLATNMGRLMNYGKNISASIAQIDEQFARTFDNPVAKDFAGRFKEWTATMQDGLKSAMRNAGLQREQFSDDTRALQGLMSNLAGAQGNLSALQALGSLNARQIQESMKLRDLISEQQIAQSNYMVAQAKKEQEKEGIDDWIRRGGQKGPIQRPLKTGKPYKYADEESNEDSNKK